MQLPWNALIMNAMALFVLPVVFQLTKQVKIRLTQYKQIITGIFIAITCIVIMLMPYELYQEVLFDSRSILISITALLFGLIPTIITIVVAILFSIIQGGGAFAPGIAVIITSAIIGLIWRFFIYKKESKLHWLSVYIMSFLVHVLMIICMSFLSYPNNENVIKEIILPVLLLYPFVSVLLYVSLSQGQEFLKVRYQLKLLEEHAQLFFDKAPIGFQSLDKKGFIIDANQQWLDTLGYTKEEVIGKWFGDFLDPIYSKKINEKFIELEKTGHIQCEFEILNKNGNLLFIEVVGYMVYEPNGSFKQTVCILKDITKQKTAETELQLSEKKYRQLFETMAQGVVYQAADGRIISANPAAERILGITLDQMMNMTSLDPGWKTVKEDGSKLSGLIILPWLLYVLANHMDRLY